MRVALSEFEGEVGGEQLLVVLGVIGELGGELDGGLVGDVFGGPDLAVGMGVAGAHHGAAVFEDLDVLDVGASAEFGCLLGPHFDDAANGRDVHGGEGEVVAGSKQRTRQRPRSVSARRRPASSTSSAAAGASG